MAERSDKDYYTPAEVAERLRALKDLDVKQLTEMAGVWSRGIRGHDGQDFLQQIFTRMLMGKRRWPRGIVLDAVLDQAFRSLRNQYVRKEKIIRARGAETLNASEAFTAEDGDPHEALAARYVDGETPLELMCGDEVIPGIEKLFSDSDEAHLIILAWQEGKKKAEILGEMGITETKYDSAVKLINRRMAAHLKE